MGESRAFWVWFSAFIIASSLLAVGLVFATVNGARARTKDDHVEVVADPIVLLLLGDEGECTGFVTNAFGFKSVVSAGHCAEAAEGKVVTAKDSIGRTFEVEAIYVDKVHDLAIFRPSGGIVAGPIDVSSLACDASPNIGDDISIIGFPLDYGRVTTYGKVSALASPWAHWPEVYRLDIFAGPGNSGSPVFNKAGQVIAILVGGNPQWVGMSLAVPVSELCHPKIV